MNRARRTSTSSAAGLSLSAVAARHSSHRDCAGSACVCSRGRASCRASSACSGAPCAACRRQLAATAAHSACGRAHHCVRTSGPTHSRCCCSRRCRNSHRRQKIAHEAAKTLLGLHSKRSRSCQGPPSLATLHHRLSDRLQALTTCGVVEMSRACCTACRPAGTSPAPAWASPRDSHASELDRKPASLSSLRYAKGAISVRYKFRVRTACWDVSPPSLWAGCVPNTDWTPNTKLLQDLIACTYNMFTQRSSNRILTMHAEPCLRSRPMIHRTMPGDEAR